VEKNQQIGLVILGVFISLILFFYVFDIADFISLSALQKHALFLAEFSRNHFFLSIFGYVTIFASIIAFSIPATGPLTLLGGFLFGVLWGSVLSTAAATAGATIAFLIFRRGLDDVVYRKHGKRVEKFKKRMETYGVFYLLMLHFSTVVPYAVINVLAAITEIPLFTVIWTTAVGFIPIAFVYTFAGSRFTTIRSIQDIFSPNVIIAFSLLIALMLVPIVLKFIQNRRSKS